MQKFASPWLLRYNCHIAYENKNESKDEDMVAAQTKNNLSGHKKNLAGILLIFLCTYLTGIQNIGLPGIYYDAVYPDYIAAVWAFPGIDNFTQITKHAGLPLLGNLYHGTLTSIVQFFVLKCFGVSNALTLRMTNLFYIGIIGAILFVFSKKISNKYLLPLVGSLLCVTAQSTLLLSRTQYYIMLPGTIFFLLSCGIIVKQYCTENYCPESKLLLAGIFQGLAFYGYFTFLFLAPVSTLIIILREKKGHKLSGAALFLWGIPIGSICYFFGYFDSLLVNILGICTLTRLLLFTGCALMLLILTLPVLVVLSPKYAPCRPKLIKIYRILGLAALIFLAVALVAALFIMPDKLQSVSGLFSHTTQRNTGSVFLLFWTLLYGLLSNNRLQYTIFGEHLNDFGGIYPLCCIVVTAILCTPRLLGKQKRPLTGAKKAIFYLYAYLFGFYLCSLPIIKGMQPQHFVPICFLMFIVIILGLCHICEFLPKYSGIAITVFLMLSAICINFRDNQIFLHLLDETGGRGRYSSAYNDFAHEAQADPEKAEKIYVFPQWGFHANFVYLTSNQCKAVRDADIDTARLQEQLDSGYTLVLAAEDEDAINKLLEALTYDESVKKIWFSKEKKQIFLSVEIK